MLGLSDSKAIIITCYYGEAASEDKRMLSGARGRIFFAGLFCLLYARFARLYVLDSSVAVNLYIVKYALRDKAPH